MSVIDGVERFIRRFCILPDAAYLPLATWTVATYVPLAFDAIPYVALLSPMKQCGKTRVLEVLELLCAKPQRVTTVSSASLFRMMEDVPTLLLDEVEALGNSKPSDTTQAVLAILNAGHRKGATVTRCVPPDWDVQHFPVYGPKVFAAIGGLTDTLTDRCIVVAMHRKTSSQSVDRFLQGRAKADAEPTRESLVAWADTYQESVRAAYEGMDDLKFLSDRDADIWMPLFAVCTVVTPERLGELQRCAMILSGAKACGDTEDSPALALLSDIRVIFHERRSDAVPSAVLADCLCKIEGRPWADWNRGQGLTANNLARQLRKYSIHPQTIRVGDNTPKGYRRVDFEELWLRYCPFPPTQTATPPQPASLLIETAFCNRNTVPSVAVAKSASNPHEQRTVAAVAVQSGQSGVQPDSEVAWL
jgi:hypothetical protein